MQGNGRTAEHETRSLRPALLVALGLAAVPAAQAASWDFRPQAEVGLGAVENQRLLVDDSDSDFVRVAGASFALVRRTEIRTLALDAGVRVLDHDDDPLDQTEYRAEWTGDWRYPRSSLSSALQWRRESTLTSERGSTGLVDVDRPAEFTTGRLGGAHDLSERTRLDAQILAVDARYPGGERYGLYDYDYRTASAQLSRSWTERARFGLVAAASDLNSDSPAQGGTEDRTLQLSMEFDLTPTTRLSAAAGRMEADLATGGKDHGASYRASLARQTERHRFGIDASRAYRPTGYGVLARQENIDAYWSMQLTERLSTDAGYSRISSRYDSVDLDDARYQSLRFGGSYRFTERLSVSAYALYQEQHYEGTGTGDGGAVHLSIQWRPLIDDGVR